MDWKNLRRDKLAKTASYRPGSTVDGMSGGFLDPVVKLWQRFLGFSPWEKGLVAGAAAVLTVLVAVAVFALGGGDSSGAAGIATPTQFKISIVRPTAGPTSTLTPTPSPGPTSSPTPEPTAVLNRRDCDEIAGTPYLSVEEREWFADQCVDEPPSGPTGPSGPSDPPPPPPPTSPPSGPPDTPTPDSRYTASEAVAYATDWVLGQPDLDAIVVPGSCNASFSDGVWVVSCRASTGGCTGGVCEITLRVCVNESPLDIFLC